MLSASDLPEMFVCFFHGSRHSRRYMRIDNDNWDVHLWTDHWQYFDNIGDKSAVRDFREATCAFQVCISGD